MRSSQHGFTKGKSCSTNLVAFYDGIASWVDGGRAADVIYLDFSKAFDTVSHDVLLAKLRKRGIDERTVRWVETWLTGRAQRVVIGGAESGRSEEHTSELQSHYSISYAVFCLKKIFF